MHTSHSWVLLLWLRIPSPSYIVDNMPQTSCHQIHPDGTQSVKKSHSNVNRCDCIGERLSIFQVSFQGQFSPIALCNLSSFSFLGKSSPKRGAQHMDLITVAVIWMCAQLIRKSSGKPKNSFRLYIILKELTHMSFRGKIIKNLKSESQFWPADCDDWLHRRELWNSEAIWVLLSLLKHCQVWSLPHPTV